MFAFLASLFFAPKESTIPARYRRKVYGVRYAQPITLDSHNRGLWR